MIRRFFRLALACALCAGFTAAYAQGDAKKGEYVAKAAGCVGCHTDTVPAAVSYAGGRVIDTPFGKFYGPNITPHPVSGLGKWSEADFRRAMRLGERPDGAHYYPAFPYPSFTGMTDRDIRDLWAYLRSLPPASRSSQAHDLRFPFSWRFTVTFWKWMFFTPRPFMTNPQTPAAVNRGAYLVGVLGHCGECHTPRNFLGGPKTSRLLAGGKIPEGRTANLTPTGLKKWHDRDLREFFRSGATPEGDVPSDAMYEVIRDTTSQLTAEDLAALMAYLRALAPIADEPR